MKDAEMYKAVVVLTGEKVLSDYSFNDFFQSNLIGCPTLTWTIKYCKSNGCVSLSTNWKKIFEIVDDKLQVDGTQRLNVSAFWFRVRGRASDANSYADKDIDLKTVYNPAD